MKEKKPIMFFLVLLFFTMLTVQSSVEYFQSDNIYFANLMWKNFISLGLSFLIGIPIASVIAYQRNK
jgi:hypothetical protein